MSLYLQAIYVLVLDFELHWRAVQLCLVLKLGADKKAAREQTLYPEVSIFVCIAWPIH